ncbi:Glycosyl transferase, family II [Desulfonema limicola]|uniref:Glycosyl transferase, family II n=1 Tax=Desulfonema limicola TaxID=45656 RepID=A0A975B3Z3_9BACT|nr:glycosyltransferase [Desulfonema limicola]QTA78377.1 Glycosyl transferase, family II [Desulfonema limicola]
MTILYSVIIPAYNEESLLPAVLSALKDAMEKIEYSGEIIVVDNNSNDKTASIAYEAGACVVFEPVNQISRARNAGAKAARGQYLVFLDADTIISPKLLKTALNNLSRGSCCGGGVRVKFDMSCEPPFVRLMVASWNQVSLRLKMAAGCFIYCLREAFEDVNGFSQKVYAGEEIWFSLYLQKWGKKRGKDFCIITDPPVITSDRKLKWFSPSQTLFMVFIIALFPFASNFRKLCPMWYQRPLDKHKPIKNKRRWFWL